MQEDTKCRNDYNEVTFEKNFCCTEEEMSICANCPCFKYYNGIGECTKFSK